MLVDRLFVDEFPQFFFSSVFLPITNFIFHPLCGLSLLFIFNLS